VHALSKLSARDSAQLAAWGSNENSGCVITQLNCNLKHMGGSGAPGNTAGEKFTAF
jgi:hypothetical protein